MLAILELRIPINLWACGIFPDVFDPLLSFFALSILVAAAQAK
jgi:hypothetical protein